MSFDESLFSFFFKQKKKKLIARIEEKKNQNCSVELDSIKEQMSFFASAIFHAPMEIRATNGLAYQSSNKIFLPSYCAQSSDRLRNLNYFKILILHLFGQYILAQERGEFEGSDFESWQKARLLSDDIQSKLTELFPNYLKIFQDVVGNAKLDFDCAQSEEKYKELTGQEFGFSYFGIFGILPKNKNILKGDDDLPESRSALPEPKSELQNNKTHNIKKINLDENKEHIGQDVFSHFEKVETLEEFNGVQREMDGEDELEMHADALDELNLQEVIRTNKMTQSLYKTELDMGIEIADSQSRTISSVKPFFYDEWDYQSRSYKKHWCTIFEENGLPEKKRDEEVLHPQKKLIEILKERQNEVETIRKKLLRATSLYQKKKKLFEGRFIDLDNYIRNFTLTQRKLSSDGRNYYDLYKKNRDLSILILVDNSLSADSWVQNQRVLNLSLESLMIFGEAIEKFSDPVMVAGFSSNTRNSCKFTIWKNFNTDWSSFKNIADDINPEGYTRIGPAIRHAKSILLKRKEKKRVLLILTDGRPTDYDRYEGVYGLSDVRKSIEECIVDGIIPFAIAVDPSAKQFLPKLFGPGNYSILLNTKKLPEILSSLYIKISK